MKEIRVLLVYRFRTVFKHNISSCKTFRMLLVLRCQQY